MILEEIAARTRLRVEAAKKAKPESELQKQAEALPSRGDYPFEEALRGRFAFICEVKKASPSKGIIAEDFPYLSIASEYEAAGAAAISVLTEPHYFLGSDTFLEEIAQAVKIPVLRKDFTIDAYQLYEAKCLGASAVLLICSLLDTGKLAEFIHITHRLGLSALVEAHDEAEVISALRAGARIIGVNNRNLRDFSVDIQNSLRLRSAVPHEILMVAESGIKTAEDILRLREAGINGVLIGETLMRAADKRSALNQLRGVGND